MKNIIFCGCGAQERRLCQALTQYGSVQYCGKEELWRQESTYGDCFCTYQFDELPQTKGINGIILLGSRLAEHNGTIAQGLTPVFDSSNRAAAQLLIHAGGAAVSCGTSPKDTFSLASINEERAVVSLQRNIFSLTGARIEPRDIPVILTGKRGVFEIMAFCAILLLCGCEPEREVVL